MLHMSQLIYNDEEQSLIDAVHSVFPKVELDPEVAIGRLDGDGEYYFADGMGTLEPWDMEAFFRGIDSEELRRLWRSDNKVFWPAQYKPIPWWEVKFKEICEMRGSIDHMVWMSPYGTSYYLPFFMLATIYDMSIIRQQLGSEMEECFYSEPHVLKCLTPPVELEGKDCWYELLKVDYSYKDSRYKIHLYRMGDALRFLIFISSFKEDQKKLISEIVEYLLKIEYATTWCFGQGDEKKEIERLKSCWSFC